MKFTDENDVLALLIEANAISETASRAARRAHVQRAKALLGTRDWARADALVAIGYRKPYSGADGARIGLARISGLSQLGTKRMTR